jgi:queuine tRNA-ribosyltransferase/7-cyano-7-deazaguanine tRNA-ribosyltransferase
MERTHRWALRAIAEHRAGGGKQQALFGIVQGGAYNDLREESARFIASLEFDGIAIGGSLGKSRKEMHQVLEWTVPLLPPDKPRHLLGIGEIEDIFEVVERGIDLIDCVAPTRLGRNGTVFVRGEERFRLHLRSARCQEDPRPIEVGCSCPTCQQHSRAYLGYLVRAASPLACYLATLHNLHFLGRLMRSIREAIAAGKFAELKREWLGESGAERGA